MAKLAQLPPQPMRPAARLKRHSARWQLRQPANQLPAVHLSAQHLSAASILRVNVKRPLTEINTYQRNRRHEMAPEKETAS